RIPGHIGVIMDGNGRWARARGKARTEGHVAGVKALRRMVELCIRYGVQYLTVFSFSSENWTRPRDEVRFIFSSLPISTPSFATMSGCASSAPDATSRSRCGG